jgi:hypothetical protein
MWGAAAARTARCWKSSRAKKSFDNLPEDSVDQKKICGRIKMERVGEDLNLTDYENWLLARFDSRNGIPVAMERLTHPAWVDHVKSDIVNSDFTWEQYEHHCRSGFGDEWFFEQDRPPGEEWGEEDRPAGKT